MKFCARDFPGFRLPGAVLQVIVVLLSIHSAGFAATTDEGKFRQLILQAETIPILIEDKAITKYEIPNPHWQKEGCLACHVSEPGEKGSPLKAASDGSCYFCHGKEEHVAVHPVDLLPDSRMLARMPAQFRTNLSDDGKTNCVTCHDPVVQGSSKRTMTSLRNRSFLRGGIYRGPSGICYRCHDQGAYQKFDPHDQIDDKGVVNTDTCLTCHQSPPRQDAHGATGELVMQVASDWSQICLNCHKWQPHPGGNMTLFSAGKPPDHLVAPDKEMLQRMALMTKKNKFDLPLEPGTGRIYCATCHNPHERGVISKASLARGADEKKRLRSSKLCTSCHNR